MKIKMKISISLKVGNNEKETYVINNFVGQDEEAKILLEAAITWATLTMQSDEEGFINELTDESHVSRKH